MLSELEKGNIVLYDGLLNEQALVSEKQWKTDKSVVILNKFLNG